MLCFKATAIKRHKTTATKCRPQGHATSSYSPSAWEIIRVKLQRTLGAMIIKWLQKKRTWKS